jgi:hypothetical protein
MGRDDENEQQQQQQPLKQRSSNNKPEENKDIDERAATLRTMVARAKRTECAGLSAGRGACQSAAFGDKHNGNVKTNGNGVCIEMAEEGEFSCLCENGFIDTVNKYDFVLSPIGQIGRVCEKRTKIEKKKCFL